MTQKHFECPKCKSNLFGRITEKGTDGRPIVTNRVECHGMSSGTKEKNGKIVEYTVFCKWVGTLAEAGL